MRIDDICTHCGRRSDSSRCCGYARSKTSVVSFDWMRVFREFYGLAATAASRSAEKACKEIVDLRKKLEQAEAGLVIQQREIAKLKAWDSPGNGTARKDPWPTICKPDGSYGGAGGGGR